MRLFAAGFIALAFVSVLSRSDPVGAAVIDFEDVATGRGSQQIAGDRYKSYGVLLSAAPGVPRAAYLPQGANTGPNILIGSDSSTEIAAEFILPGTLTPGVTGGVSFYTAGRATPIWWATAYDLHGQAIDARTGTGGGALVSFSHGVPDIHRVVFHSQPEWLGMDTLAFGTILPEPTSLTLVAAGAVIARHRRGGRRREPGSGF